MAIAGDTAALLRDARELDLTTIGRTTGQPRTVEMWFAYDDGYVYFLAGLSGGLPTHWYRNLQAHPDATLRVRGRSIPARAEPVEDLAGEDRGGAEEQVMRLFQQKYGSQVMRTWYEGGHHLPLKLRVVS